MDLLAAPVERIAVKPTRDVVIYGARACSVPKHAHVPAPRPKSLHTDEEWLLVLRVAERQIRWRHWTRPHPLPLDSRPDECLGGGGGYWYDSKGVAIWSDDGAHRYATWAVLLRGLREQREREPHIADARDLAHAYSAVETHDRYYIRDGGSVASNDDGEWRERVAAPHLAKLRQIVTDLGGDPDLVLVAASSSTHPQSQGAAAGPTSCSSAPSPLAIAGCCAPSFTCSESDNQEEGR